MKALAVTGVTGHRLVGGLDLQDLRPAEARANDKSRFGQNKVGQVMLTLADLITDRNGDLSEDIKDQLGGFGNSGILMIASRLARNGMDLSTECRVVKFKDKGKPELYCKVMKYAESCGRIHSARIKGGRK